MVMIKNDLIKVLSVVALCLFLPQSTTMASIASWFAQKNVESTVWVAIKNTMKHPVSVKFKRGAFFKDMGPYIIQPDDWLQGTGLNNSVMYYAPVQNFEDIEVCSKDGDKWSDCNVLSAMGERGKDPDGTNRSLFVADIAPAPFLAGHAPSSDGEVGFNIKTGVGVKYNDDDTTWVAVKNTLPYPVTVNLIKYGGTSAYDSTVVKETIEPNKWLKGTGNVIHYVPVEDFRTMMVCRNTCVTLPTRGEICESNCFYLSARGEVGKNPDGKTTNRCLFVAEIVPAADGSIDLKVQSGSAWGREEGLPSHY